MIRVQSGYYYCEDQPNANNKKQKEQVRQKNNENERKTLPLEVIGDVKGYIQHVATQVKRIKQLKAKQKQEQLANKLILDQLMGKQDQKILLANQQKSQIHLTIAVPPQIYEFDQRISKLEQKITNDEIVRQKIQRKGKLSQRAKLLMTQIQKLQQKSPQIIGNNIQNFCKTLDQREQQSKVIFLYQAFTKTHTLTEQIEMLSVYLTNLNEIQTKLKALPPQKMIVDNHEKLLARRKQNQERITKLYKYMTQQYEKLIKQIDSI